MANCCIVYYSRTGFTRSFVRYFARYFREQGFNVDVFEVKPIKEYRSPLHINPRLIFETLFRGWTEIRVEPKEPDILKYDFVVLASPIWFGTITPPMRCFVRMFGVKGVKAVNITVEETDVDVLGLVIIVEGDSIDFEELKETIENHGAAIHGIDQIVAGDYIIEYPVRPAYR